MQRLRSNLFRTKLVRSELVHSQRPRSQSTRRLGGLALAVAAVGLTLAGPASAQAAPDEGEAAAEEGAAKAEDGKDSKETKKADADTTANNPNLAPGGVVTGGSSFPLHLNLSMTTSLGIGTFSPGYTNNPLLGQSFSIAPNAKIPTFGLYDKPVILSGRVGVGVTNFFKANTDGLDSYIATPRLTDASAQFVFPGMFVEPFTKIAVTPIVQLRLPLSLSSWQANVMFSTAAAAVVSYNGVTDFGVFTVQYVPSGRYTHHHTAGPTRDCSDFIEGGRNTDPWMSASANLGDVPQTAVCREDEKLDDGRAIVPGRQIMATVGNSGTLAYTTPGGSHNFSLSLSHTLAFVRPLTSQPDLSSLNASNQSFIEFTSGSLSYTYTVPIDLRVFVTTGISTFGPAMDPRGYLRFPLFDFYTPQQNLTTGFLSIALNL